MHSMFNRRYRDYIWLVLIKFNTFSSGWKDSSASAKVFSSRLTCSEPSEGKPLPRRHGQEGRGETTHTLVGAVHARVWRQNQTPRTVIPALCASAGWAEITKQHIKPFSSLSQKGWGEGNTRSPWGAVRMPLARVPGESSGFMNTWDQACELVFKQFQLIIKGFSQVNENQSSRPKHLFWQYLFFKDFCILN